MSNGAPSPDEAGGLRARAARCRAFANEYASDVGASLNELAVELDLKADRLDAREKRVAEGAEQQIGLDPMPNQGA